MGAFLSTFGSFIRRLSFFHDDDIKQFGEQAIKRVKAERLRRKVKKEHRKMQRMFATGGPELSWEFPVPDTSEMNFTSDEEGNQDSEMMVTIKGVTSDSTPTGSNQEAQVVPNNLVNSEVNKPEPISITLPSTKASENMSDKNILEVKSGSSKSSQTGIPKTSSGSEVVKKPSPIERMKEREEQKDFLAVTASAMMNRNALRRVGSSRKTRGQSPMPGKLVTVLDAKVSQDNTQANASVSCVYDESWLRKEIDAIRLETILDNEEEEEAFDENHNDRLYFYANGANGGYPGTQSKSKESVVQEQSVYDIGRPTDRCVSKPNISSAEELHSPLFASSEDTVARNSSTIGQEYAVEDFACNNSRSEEETGDVQRCTEITRQSVNCRAPELPEVWSEIEIFALIEFPNRGEPLRIEYHRFGSTLDFSTRPSMNPTFSSNMTREDISSFFEGDLDVDSKYGAEYALAVIPKLMNVYEGFLLVNGLELKINRSPRMAMHELHVNHHKVLVEIVPNLVTEVGIRKSEDRSTFKIEWKDGSAEKATKWMTVTGQEDKICQLELTKSPQSKSILILSIPL